MVGQTWTHARPPHFALCRSYVGPLCHRSVLIVVVGVVEIRALTCAALTTSVVNQYSAWSFGTGVDVSSGVARRTGVIVVEGIAVVERRGRSADDPYRLSTTASEDRGS